MQLTQPEIKIGEPAVIKTATEFIEEFIASKQEIVDKYEEEISALVATEYVIESQEAYDTVAEGLKSNKGLQSRIDSTFETPTDLAFKLHRSLSKPRSDLLLVLKSDEGLRKDAMKGFLQRQEAARRLEEAARIKKANEEAEAQRAIEVKKIEEQRLNAAATLTAEGNTELAETVLSAPIMAPKIVPIMAPPTQPTSAVKGISTKKIYKHRITDPTLIPRQYLMIDEKKIASVVKAMGPEHGIAGVEAVEDMSIGSRKV